MNDMLSFFKDKHGKWAIAQFPNSLLLTWLLLFVLSVFVTDQLLRSSIEQLKNTILFTWAYLEFTNGSSSFRRVFGAVIMTMIIVSYFV